MNILIVDDQRSARLVLRDILQRAGGLVLYEAASLDEARRRLAGTSIDVALIDIRLSADGHDRDGLTLISEIRARHPSTAAIVVTVLSEMAEIRRAIRGGAYDYILKDELCDELVLPVIAELRSRRRLEAEVLELRSRGAADAVRSLIGDSPAMERLRTAIRRVALSDRAVLVTGPTGSGKELVVRAIHALGPQPNEPLLDINCGAIPEQLIEAQLFGHEKGAFTGADRRQVGFFGAAGRGTLFLDEIAELPLGLQAKLLRVLESGRFRPVGSTVERSFAGRVVAATHASLEERVREGRFREDLFYRLNVLQVHVPGLDERKEDIGALIEHFARRQRRPMTFTAEALQALGRASWPGNVRQLRNLVDRLAVFCDEETITVEALATIAGPQKPIGDASVSLRAIAAAILDQVQDADPLGAIEKALIYEALARAGGTRTGAAQLLGVDRKVIERRLK
jgi:two-component system response regulator HydG